MLIGIFVPLAKVEQKKQEVLKTDLEALIKESREEEKRSAAVAAEKETLGMLIGIFVPLATTAMTVALPLILGDEPMNNAKPPMMPQLPPIPEEMLKRDSAHYRQEIGVFADEVEVMQYSKRQLGGLGGIANMVGGLLMRN